MDQYIFDPTGDEREQIEQKFAKTKFPGCIGCLECAVWDWENCPKALQRIMKGKEIWA